MSEEASDVTTGSAPGKRPLDLTSDLNADSDDSSIAAKRIKVVDENNKVDSPKSHNAISNGGLDSPPSNGEDRHEPEDNGNQEEQAESLPRHVKEADPQPLPQPQPEENGTEEDPASASKTNSDEPAPCNSNIEKSDEDIKSSEQEKVVDPPSEKAEVVDSPSEQAEVVDPPSEKAEVVDPPSEQAKVVDPPSEKAEVVDPPSEKAEVVDPPSEKDQADQHKEESNSVNVSNVNPDRTDSSGSCNGEDSKQLNNASESVLDSEKDESNGDKVNGGAESDSEAMEVDVENDTVDTAGTGSELKLEAKSELASTSEPHSVTDTSVPKDSSGVHSETVDNTKSVQPVEEDKDSQHSAKDSDSNDIMEVTPNDEDNDSEKPNKINKEDKEKEETALSEKTTTQDSTSDVMEVSEDNKENKNRADLLVDCLHLLSEEQHEARSIIMKKLQEELRNEETKLLLLKKLRLNQQQPVSVPTKPEGAAAAAAAAVAVAAAGTNGTGPAHGHRTGLPPNMPHSSITGTKPHASIQPQSNSSSHRPDMPQLMRGSHIQRQLLNYQKGHSGPPPLIMAQQTSRSSSSSSTSQSGQMVRAPVVRISTSASAPTTSTHSVSRQMQHQQQPNSRQSQLANDGQSAASRQAAAKLALRKQLEKTLLQIPPPKPPPPELHFLPSAANNEFIILVGLEEVVNTILDLDKKDKTQSKGFLQPYKCAQCNTDFTTIWKQVKVDPKQGIMCESCIVSNQKKALKAEHTNRLKTAFVKALQQEQEIEQRIQQSQSTTQQPSTSRVSSSQQRHRTQNVVHRSQASSGMHHSSSASQAHRQRVMNPAPSQRVVQPIHYAYIPNFPVTAPQIQIIPKQHMMPQHRSSADRQREYLLDMIPSKGLGHPQNSVIWKR